MNANRSHVIIASDDEADAERLRTLLTTTHTVRDVDVDSHALLNIIVRI